MTPPLRAPRASLRLSAFLSLFFFVQLAAAQSTDPILGAWFGTSLCADKATDRACKDEVILYRFRPDSAVPHRANLDAWKLVGRDTVFMGTLPCDPTTGRSSWTSEFKGRSQVRWSYTVSDSTLTGTLVELPSERLVRRVHAMRVKP